MVLEDEYRKIIDSQADTINTYNKVFKTQKLIIDDLKRQTAWTLTNDKLPENCRPVLAFDIDDGISIKSYMGGYWEDAFSERIEENEILAWKDLPDPPLYENISMED